MLKEKIVTATWKCDGCGAEVVAEENPFVHVHIKKNPVSECEIDLCTVCSVNIPSQEVADYLAAPL